MSSSPTTNGVSVSRTSSAMSSSTAAVPAAEQPPRRRGPGRPWPPTLAVTACPPGSIARDTYAEGAAHRPGPGYRLTFTHADRYHPAPRPPRRFAVPQGRSSPVVTTRGPCTQSSKPAASSIASSSAREIEVDRLDVEPGQTIDIDRVLLVADGDQAAVGQPVVDGAHVSASVVRQARGEKIVVFKYKPKARTRVKQGHRADLTVLRIADIAWAGRSAAKEQAKVDAEQEQGRRGRREGCRRAGRRGQGARRASSPQPQQPRPPPQACGQADASRGREPRPSSRPEDQAQGGRTPRHREPRPPPSPPPRPRPPSRGPRPAMPARRRRRRPPRDDVTGKDE